MLWWYQLCLRGAKQAKHCQGWEETPAKCLPGILCALLKKRALWLGGGIQRVKLSFAFVCVHYHCSVLAASISSGAQAAQESSLQEGSWDSFGSIVVCFPETGKGSKLPWCEAAESLAKAKLFTRFGSTLGFLSCFEDDCSHPVLSTCCHSCDGQRQNTSLVQILNRLRMLLFWINSLMMVCV